MIKLFLLLNWIQALQLPLRFEMDKQQLNTKEVTELKTKLDFSRSSYCYEDLQNWNCTTCSETLQVSDINIVGEVSNSFGYVAYSKYLNTIVVAFRGTRNLNNWIRDLRWAKPDCPFPDAPEDAKIHLGFLQTWEELKPQVIENLMNLTMKYPKSHLLITGHSLGGAISTLAAVDLYSSYADLNVLDWTVFTIGEPRVGNPEFAQWFSSFPFISFRVINQIDITPHLPPKWSGFLHSGREVWIENDEGDTFYCEDVENLESKQCANSNHVYSMVAHLQVWDISIGRYACNHGDDPDDGDWHEDVSYLIKNNSIDL
ncbi:Alpha/Beta hydrolase protein [Globomyces pollinis-pini]|nr:Alpha/Beta hydrolase protein [Globomyces pollinis-pini]